MNENEKYALVTSPSRAIEKIAPGVKRILSSMVADTLAAAKRGQSVLAEARFRIGDYEWREPDYCQILLWAKAMVMEPLEVIQQLVAINEQWKRRSEEEDEIDEYELGPIFDDGAIKTIYWDFDLLPLKTFEWVEGLVVRELVFTSSSDKAPTIALNLPHLVHLACQMMDLTELDLSGVPRLTSLYCDGNKLTKLDLSKVPMLSNLDCGSNQLCKLHLSGVPMLIELHCQSNRLTKLDVSHVPRLKQLNCTHNKLAELDLSGSVQLTDLGCGGNQLTKLDLFKAPKLNSLNCWDNRIAELDLSHVPMLETLNCIGNKLEKLDITAQENLKVLYYFHVQAIEARPHLIQRPDQYF